MALAAFFFLFAGFAGLMFWGVRHTKRRERERNDARAQRARQRGWRYDEKPAPNIDYRFSGDAHGIPWTLDFESDGEGGGKAVWRAPSLHAAQPTLLIVNPIFDKLMQGRAGKWLGRAIAANPKKAKHGLGLYTLPHRVDTGSEAFRKYFTARALDPSLPRHVIDHEVQQRMLRLLTLSVAYSTEGLQIECGSQLHEVDQLEDVIHLGTHLAQKLR